jgi:hypothetical protein
MPATTSERVAVLVIRAWTEGQPPSLRVRITRTQDVASRIDVTSTASTVAQVHDEVEAWLRSFLAGDGPGAT